MLVICDKNYDYDGYTDLCNIDDINYYDYH